jgi:hypothetical protein
VERQLAEAGVETDLVKTRPGDELIVATGASQPSGIPIPEGDFARLLEGPKKHQHPRGARGPREHRPSHALRGNRRRDREQPLVGRWGDDRRN